MIHTGDCLEVMPTLPAESIDAVVTDPPYGLGFMGKHWDHGLPGADFWREMLRVAKPGAHLLAFGGTRTYHRLACAIEDAGWEIRDCLVWAYASGFPKSLNLPGGWGTALKPAWEPIVLARKPLRGTVARNVQEFGTGALNIDGCRIGYASDADADAVDAFQRFRSKHPGGNPVIGIPAPPETGSSPLGRWPANVILTDPIFDGDVPGVVGGGEAGPAGVAVNRNRVDGSGGYGGWARGDGEDVGYGDSGTYSRFFLVPKAARSDREPVLGGLPVRLGKIGNHGNLSAGDDLSAKLGANNPRANHHPTVKPTDLMRHLVRLVTPPGGTVLDPFLGSGTTAIACELEGFAWLGIEKEPEYVAIAEARLNGTQRGMGLGA